jgi:2'-5' RNA ligase
MQRPNYIRLLWLPMRSFFALKPDVRTCLAIDSWRAQSWPLLQRPVPIANVHLTLAFLGEIDDLQLHGRVAAVDELCFAPIEVELNEVGYWSKSALLWLGPRQVPPALPQLAAKLGELGQSQGQRKDKRRYQPHLTLARRVVEPPPAALIPPRFPCRFETFALYESQPTRNGRAYRTVASWPLAEFKPARA